VTCPYQHTFHIIKTDSRVDTSETERQKDNICNLYSTKIGEDLTSERRLLALHEGPKFVGHIELVVLIAVDLKLATNSLGRHGL